MMLTGIELIRGTVGRIGELQPGAVKIRRPELAGPVREAVPEALLIGRPGSEGYSAGEMIGGWENWVAASPPEPWRWILANEPNHVHSPWYADPEGWEAQAREALDAMGPAGWGRTWLGGLMPLFQVPADIGARWLAVYDRLALDYRLARSGHVYNQAGTSIDDGLRQVGGVQRAMIDELGDSGPNGDPAKVDRLVHVVRSLAATGVVDVAILFCHDPWQDADGIEFGLPLDWQARILSAVPGGGGGPGPVPPPGGGPMDRWAQFPQGPGIRAAMEANGDRPTSLEWYPANRDGVEVGVGVSFGEKGQYVYSKVDNQVRLIPFR